MKKFILPVAALFMTFVLFSCTKEVTKVVPGDNNSGTPAQSAVYSIMPEDWAANSDSTALTATLDVPELTDAIFDHGAVVVYLSFKDGIYEAVPQVFDFNSYNAIHSVGQVQIEVRDVDGYIVNPITVEVYAKVVLIDAEKLAMHPDVNFANYDEVKQTFHLH